MTLLSELIEIPHEVHKSDFVISLKSAIEQPERTIADYVVTPQLEASFLKMVQLVEAAVTERTSSIVAGDALLTTSVSWRGSGKVQAGERFDGVEDRTARSILDAAWRKLGVERVTDMDTGTRRRITQ